MAIYKYYKVYCDKCNNLIITYRDYKPSITQLRKDCGKVRINNGKPIILCESCCNIEKSIEILEEYKAKKIKDKETVSSNLDSMLEMYKSGFKNEEDKENI